MQQKIYFTANQQFGRPSAIRDFQRPFENVEDMNLSLEESWNSTVEKDDIVYVLGNFAWDPQTARAVLKRLNGQIYFMIGSADEAFLDIQHEFENVSILEDQILELPQFDSIISHYPLEVWNGKDS